MSPARIELTEAHPLADPIRDFLGDLRSARRSPHTVRGYRSDLAEFASHHPSDVDQIDVTILRTYFTALEHQAASTQARKQASLAAFLRWCHRHGLVDANPMDLLDRTQVPEAPPRGVDPARVEKVLAAIPKRNLRDRVLFTLIARTGVRAGEALGVHVEDLTLTADDEHVTVHGKGGRSRTILLDDSILVALLRRYLRATGYTHGPLFRASKNHIGGPLRYASAQELWAKYNRLAGEDIELHQLRHTHATELVNGGVSLQTIRKRLGHRKIQTSLRYAEHSDRAADDELRRWRRRR
ncbi:tyrosine-type recombinase/integrase [Micromonospora aurantiaca (nom. illeg.)]|uniref:tyrosine-type recombinase/integrase n=1 Tax=Micromonospora aurantiaca (nom. illeg.) TaxID=47850 RepID=UPI00340D15B8